MQTKAIFCFILMFLCIQCVKIQQNMHEHIDSQTKHAHLSSRQATNQQVSHDAIFRIRQNQDHQSSLRDQQLSEQNNLLANNPSHHQGNPHKEHPGNKNKDKNKEKDWKNDDDDYRRRPDNYNKYDNYGRRNFSPFNDFSKYAWLLVALLMLIK